MQPSLAVYGGPPVRETFLPYGRQSIDDDDVASVVAALRSDWLTTGPLVDQFERTFSQFVGTSEAVAVSSGTAALHAAMYAAGIGPGDEVLVPAITFAASANSVVFQGGTPIFIDVQPDTLLVDPEVIEQHVTSRTRAILTVDYAGQPADYDRLRRIAHRHGLPLISDACHALGATYAGQPVGSLADLSAFSLHPVKPITTGEGGMITTDDPEMARRMRLFRNHGITTDHRQRQELGSWMYEMVDLGYNYRISDVQCALGISQLRKLPEWIVRRQEIARQYDDAFSASSMIRPLAISPGRSHAFHLYVIRLRGLPQDVDRGFVFRALRAEGIGVNVHYLPVYRHPFYRRRIGDRATHCPVAEGAYEQILSLPMFPGMTDGDVDDVIEAFYKVTAAITHVGDPADAAPPI